MLYDYNVTVYFLFQTFFLSKAVVLTLYELLIVCIIEIVSAILYLTLC